MTHFLEAEFTGKSEVCVAFCALAMAGLIITKIQKLAKDEYKTKCRGVDCQSCYCKTAVINSFNFKIWKQYIFNQKE